MTETLPNFIVIGAMKAGTTSLWQYLRKHPQVFMSALKEPGYFTVERRWHLGRDWYASLFEEGTGKRAIGEASTSYTKFPRFSGQPARMAALIPDVRLIYLVRNPIERVRSHYVHNVAQGEENVPIDRAIFENPDYLDFSRYALQLEQYLNEFGDDQFLVLRSEDLKNDRRASMQRIYDFLDIEDWDDPILDKEFHGAGERRRPLTIEGRIRSLPGYSFLASRLPRSTKKKARRLTTKPVDVGSARVSEELAARIMEELSPDLERLSSLTGIDTEAWRKRADGRAETSP
ncbi:MAG TPA: sulfotransferase [Actinomycetota bacterium]|nr:sulfotransferase [Actinomycetota bacterium]